MAINNLNSVSGINATVFLDGSLATITLSGDRTEVLPRGRERIPQPRDNRGRSSRSRSPRDQGRSTQERSPIRQRQPGASQRPTPSGRARKHCLNCNRDGHATFECVGPIGPVGKILDVCVGCDRKGHCYNDKCPQWNESKDSAARRLIWDRQNKPEASNVNLADLLEERVRQNDDFWLKAYDFYLPWTGLYAWDYQKQQEGDYDTGKLYGHWPVYEYKYPGRPLTEAKTRPSDPKRGKVADVHEAIEKLRSSGYGPPRGAASSSQQAESSQSANPRQLRASAVFAQAAGAVRPRPTQDSSQQVALPRASPAHTTFRSRASSVAPIREVEDWCTNCETTGHISLKCNHDCRHCGSKHHSCDNCPHVQTSCICAPFPEHQAKDCKKPCVVCGPEEPEHPAISCERVCQVCAAPGHPAISCPDFRTQSKPYRCKPIHLLQDCDKRYCPVEDCLQPFGCAKHCLTCGYPRDLENTRIQKGGRSHLCKWDKIPRNDSGFQLVCPTCKSKTGALDLESVRSAAIIRCVKECDRDRALGLTPKTSPWDRNRPECETCFKNTYPRGLYVSQIIPRQAAAATDATSANAPDVEMGDAPLVDKNMVIKPEPADEDTPIKLEPVDEDTAIKPDPDA